MSTNRATLRPTVCDYCRHPGPSSNHYLPRGSARGARVFQCTNCGLVQTHYEKVDGFTRHLPSISADAGWGNIRHGKALRIDATWSVVVEHMRKLRTGSYVLDVGTNRADFLKRASVEFPKLVYRGLEPDSNLAMEWQGIDQVQVEVARLEDLQLPTSTFDFIFCYHTLEHADSATGMLRQLRSCAREDAELLLEVPDVSVVLGEGVVEEFFIDKHSFHFSSSVLRQMLRSCGWEVTRDFSDGRNISFVCIARSPREQGQYEFDRLDLGSYGTKLDVNRSKLASVAKQIEQLDQRQQICLWGAGRIFDSLCQYGNLRARDALIVDTYLSRHLDSVNGFKLHDPSILATKEIDVCVLLASGAVPALKAEVRKYGIRHVTTFDELFLPLISR